MVSLAVGSMRCSRYEALAGGRDDDGRGALAVWRSPYLKTEDPEESYHDIKPLFLPKLRLKVGTFKAELARLLKRDIDIIFILPCS